jgi:hypothetical protein
MMSNPTSKIRVEDCDGEPMDIQGLLVEVNMWAKAKLKTAITTDRHLFCSGGRHRLRSSHDGRHHCNGSGSNLPEFMLVTGFDEENKFIQVERGYRNTTTSNWKKGACMRIFRIMNAPGQTELVFEDIVNSRWNHYQGRAYRGQSRL